jgi:hypothetical protein
MDLYSYDSVLLLQNIPESCLWLALGNECRYAKYSGGYKEDSTAIKLFWQVG